MLQLDLLRGLAILLVLGMHNPIPWQKAGVFKPIAWTIHCFGWTGVDLFFVLSGFLVGGLLFKELRTRGSLDVRRFLIRRGFKIWPAYYLFLLFVFVVDIVINHGRTSENGGNFLPNLLHVQNYFGGVRGHTWTLAVEEHFYLALPLLLAFLISRRKGQINTLPAVPILAAFVMIACTSLRLLNSIHPYTRETHNYPTHLRVDSLFFGVLLSYFYHFHPQKLKAFASHRIPLLLLALLLLSPMFFLEHENKFVWTFGYNFLYVGYGCLLLAIIHTPLDAGWMGRLLGSRLARLVAFIGYYSYSIYLWHMDLAVYRMSGLLKHGMFVRLPQSASWLLATPLYACMAIVIGVLLGILIERPSLALRNRLFPARADAIDR